MKLVEVLAEQLLEWPGHIVKFYERFGMLYAEDRSGFPFVFPDIKLSEVGKDKGPVSRDDWYFERAAKQVDRIEKVQSEVIYEDGIMPADLELKIDTSDMRNRLIKVGLIEPEDGKQEPKDEQVWFEGEAMFYSYCPKHHEQQLMLEADDCEYPSPEEQAYQDKITKETLEKVNRDLQEKEHKRDIAKSLFVMADPHANQLGLNQFMGGHIESN